MPKVLGPAPVFLNKQAGRDGKAQLMGSKQLWHIGEKRELIMSLQSGAVLPTAASSCSLGSAPLPLLSAGCISTIKPLFLCRCNLLIY